jgi:hypothetical protein
MIAKLFKLKDVGGKGKGLFAKDLILKGTIVSFECTRCRRISKQDFESISTMEKSFISNMVTEKQRWISFTSM